AGTSTTLIPGPVTTEEKAQKKNNVKAKSMLLMALSNEHLLTFNQYKDAKSLFAAIETRFGGNEATKKTQKTLLKQMYENFSATSTKSLYSIFNRLQKIWNTYVVVWRNKPDLDTISIDDLCNNFKIVKQEFKGTASSNLISQNMAFVSSPSTNSTNEIYTANGVSTASNQSSTASTQVSTASSQTSTANLSDATVYAFLTNQSNGSQLSYMAEDEVPTNMALMAFSDSESKNASKDIPNELKENLDALLVEGRVSDTKDCSVESLVVVEKKTDVYTIAIVEFVRTKQQEKPVKKPVKPNSAVVNAVKENKVNAVKASTCCVWRPTKPDGASTTLKRHNYIDGHPQKDMLPLGDEQMVEELLCLKMCDKKNSVLFTDTGCFVLSLDFKLADESQVLLKVPRKNNMYNVDMKNIVPKESLTYLTFFLKTKDETSGILRNFIIEIENLKELRVKIIRCDNGGKFRNKEMNDFCARKGIKREFSNARTPQQNGVAKRRNRTLIEAARTMLADAKLPVTFRAEAVNTACYVQNRVLVNKSQNKTPYELF
nr:putative ribonuclease H-like domain-containing protein [Tanacetum cinerariifolium]